MITVIAIGKKHEDWVRAGIERYQQRLKPPYDIDWVLLPHSTQAAQAARAEESERIMKRIPQGALTVLLDERGRQLDSPGLSRLIEGAATNSRRICIIIGGAYGVSQQMMDTADVTLGLSKMVFPHQLVRLILTEQVYRAQEIARGGGYHHE